jgi:hypothetical protein
VPLFWGNFDIRCIVHALWHRIYGLFRLTLLTMQFADTCCVFGIDGGCTLAEPQYERGHGSHGHSFLGGS